METPFAGLGASLTTTMIVTPVEHPQHLIHVGKGCRNERRCCSCFLLCKCNSVVRRQRFIEGRDRGPQLPVYIPVNGIQRLYHVRTRLNYLTPDIVRGSAQSRELTINFLDSASSSLHGLNGLHPRGADTSRAGHLALSGTLSAKQVNLLTDTFKIIGEFDQPQRTSAGDLTIERKEAGEHLHKKSRFE
jgi:hypothetical protein